jgi:glycosyltransferase involved in cell wall biosynthesis
MRILVVAQDFPWPTATGSRQRLANVITALSGLGDVDLFSLAWPDRPDPMDLPADAPVRRSTISLYPANFPFPDVSLRGRLHWLRSGLPYELSAGDFSGPREALAQWRDDPYDFVWVSRAATYSLLGTELSGPLVIDVDDLEDHKHRARLAAARYPRSLAGQAHRLTAEVQGRLNISRWEAVHEKAAQRAAALAVCSSVDAARLGAPNAVVVPNGYRAPDEPLGRPTSSDPPVVLLQGVLFYPPNSDGARWLAAEVMPLLQARVPGVTLRLVGPNAPDIEALHAPPAIEVTGWVEQMEPELRRADVIVAPIRFGSGTRVKILEGFAHRIPVVSTTAGAEGLDVVAGRHLLVADDAEGFARACQRLLTDDALRADVTAAAYALFAERYEWTAIHRVVQDLARAAVDGAPAADSGRHG